MSCLQRAPKTSCPAQAGHDGVKTNDACDDLVVPIDTLAPLVALLCRDRARLEALQGDRLAGLFAIAIRAVVDAQDRGIDLGDELALAVARAQLDRAVGLGGCAVREIGMILVLVLEVLERVARLFQD